MPANTYPIEKVGAFYIDETALRSFVEITTKFTKVGYTVSVVFRDDFAHESRDIASVLSHPEFRSNRCKSFSVRSHTPYAEDQRNEIRISCYQSSGTGKIKADISSDTDDLHIVKAEVEREVKSIRTRYDFLYRIKDGIWFGLFLALGLFAGYKLGAWLSSVSKDQTKDALTTITAGSMPVGVVGSMMLLYLGNKAKMITYPSFTIAIGKAKDEFSFKADTRKWAYRAIAAAAIGYIAKTYFFTS